MKLTDRQQQFPIPWANTPESGTLSPIPKEDPGDGSASLAKGFPKATMTPIAAGGKPPRGDQFNGIFNQLSLSAQNHDMGVVPAWRADFAQAIGGYPLTAQVTVIKNGTPDILVSLCDNNLDNPADPRQSNWASIKTGLQTAGTFIPTEAAEKNGYNGISFMSCNDQDKRIYANAQNGRPWSPLADLKDLDKYQIKGNYIPSYAGDADKQIINLVHDARQATIKYQTQDGKWHSTLPVGTIIMVSSYNIPWGWLQLAGQSFDKNMFPELFNFMGTDYLPDYRGRFPRGCGGSWINVPAVGTYQGDTIRNITGNTSAVTVSNLAQYNGAFGYSWRRGVDLGADMGGNPDAVDHISFDASRVVPTDWENRPLSVISNYIVKAF